MNSRRREPWAVRLALLAAMVAVTGATAPVTASNADIVSNAKLTENVQVTIAPTVRSSVVPGQRTLVFKDSFDGAELAPDRWVPCYPWWNGEGCEHLVNNELQWYVPPNDVMAGQRLEMTATTERILGEDEQGNPLWYDYASGMATTAGRFEFTYGYVDPQEGTSVRGVSRGWHTYAVDWQPGSVSWYLDGDRVFRIHDAPTQPMYLLMNLAVGGDWPGPPDDTTEFPATFDVRSVKVRQ